MHNRNVRDHAEIRGLREVYKGVEENDERLISLGRARVELFRAFFKDDYTSRSKKYVGIIASEIGRAHV